MTKSADRPKVRLFVELRLAKGDKMALEANQSHYLMHVMRLSVGSRLALFNGRQGEWLAKIMEIEKRAVTVEVFEKIFDQTEDADLWLLFAPLKKARLDYMVEKAVELGVGRLCPISTERTVVRVINPGRLAAHAIHAAEQCGRLSVPEVEEIQKLATRLGDWPDHRRLIYCDEFGQAATLAETLATLKQSERSAPWAILIGPEGGFTEQERRQLRDRDFITPASLGPLVLRADTAAVTAIALWQSLVGQWVGQQASH